MDDRQALARLIELFHELPTMSTDAVMDIWRTEVDGAMRAQEQAQAAMHRAMSEENDASYRYAIARRRDVEGHVLSEYEMRLTEQELREYAKQQHLNYASLYDVAVGNRERYEGWYQGEFIRSTIGKKYEKPRPKPKPEPEKVGASGLFRSAKRIEVDEY